MRGKLTLVDRVRSIHDEQGEIDEDALGCRQSPIALDQFGGGHRGSTDAYGNQLTSRKSENESLREDGFQFRTQGGDELRRGGII